GRDHGRVRSSVGQQREEVSDERVSRPMGDRAVTRAATSRWRRPRLRPAPAAGPCVAAALALSACSDSPADAVAQQWGLLNEYCTDCHNDSELAGSLSLAGVTPQHVAEDPATWEEIVRKLRGDLMPPPGGPRPE